MKKSSVVGRRSSAPIACGQPARDEHLLRADVAAFLDEKRVSEKHIYAPMCDRDGDALWLHDLLFEYGQRVAAEIKGIADDPAPVCTSEIAEFFRLGQKLGVIASMISDEDFRAIKEQQPATSDQRPTTGGSR